MANNKVVFGDETLIDLTGDTVTPADLAQGVTAHDASGQQIQGTATPGGATSLDDLSDVEITNPLFGQGLFFDGTKWVNFRSGFFVASYGNSTYAEVLAAYKANLMVYCRASSNSDPATGNQLRMAFLAYVNDVNTPTEFEFQYYRSVATHSNSQQGDQVIIYKLNSSGTWSVTTRNTFTKISVNSSTMSSTYNNGELILSANGGGSGSTVVANPEDESSADLSKLKVDGITYAIPTVDFGDVTEVRLVQSLPADASSHPTTLYLIEEV